MEISVKWTLVWLAVTSLVAVVFTMWDKYRARRNGWRVPERNLWLAAALGGSVAMYTTMLLVRHKTLHRSFMIGLPLLILAQAGVILGLWYVDVLIFI